jgi:hypothetical protein
MKSEESDTTNNTANQEFIDYLQSFQNLAYLSLEKIGIDNDCEISNIKNWSSEDEDSYNKLLVYLNYNDLFIKVILEELEKYRKAVSNPSKSEFVKNYFTNFHHIMIAQYTPEFIQSRNNKLLSAYKNIIKCIDRIQGWMDNEKVRFKIESDYSNSSNHISTIYQCTTSFCIVSLGCDQIGRYNIVYTLDYRIKEIIGSDFASTLIRRIYDFTPGEMEPFVNFHSLQGDCINTFNEIFQLTQIEENHVVTQMKRFEGKSFSDEFKLRDDIDDETRKWFDK